MIIFFTVIDPSGKKRRVSAVSSPSTTATGAIHLLRTRLAIPESVSVTLLLENEVPIKHLTAPLTSLRKQRGGCLQVMQLHLHAVLEGDAEALKEVDFSQMEDVTDDEEAEENARRRTNSVPARNAGGRASAPAQIIKPSPLKGRTSRNESPQQQQQQPDNVTPVPVRIARPPSSTKEPAERVTKKNPRQGSPTARQASRSTGRPSDNVDNTPPVVHHDEDLDLTTGMKSEKVKGVYRTGYARRDIPLASIIMKEYPKVCENDPTQIVLAIKDDERLLTRSYDKHYAEKSTIEGVSDALYSQALSVGMTHAIETRSGSLLGQKLALYGEMWTVQHSCYPNAMAHYDVYAAPFTGSLRCARTEGLKKGDEITMLYRLADSQSFLLLSKERRQNLLRRRYFFECECSRCKGVALAAESEASLTGVFFTDSSVDKDAVKQKALSEEMHADFDALMLMDDTGVEINLSLPGNVPPVARTKQCNRILGFLRKYGSTDSVLRLHEHHWRMNLARAAYVQETVRLCAVKGATPDARKRDPNSRSLFTPTKTVYDVCLKQMVVESNYIPSGHPHRLTTYESFQFLISILPANIAQSVMRTATNTTKIDWKELEQTKAAWDIFKRSALPPQVQQRLSKHTTS